MEPIMFEMHTMNNHDLNVKIMTTLRDLLDTHDQWSLVEEGEWEEYAKPTGAFYGDLQDAFEYIEELEQRVYDDLGLVCYADGESGMYRIDSPENI